MHIKRLSKSLAGVIRQCPWYADQIHNHGAKRQSSPAAEFGIKFHRLVARIIEGKITIDQVECDDDMKGLLERALDFLPQDNIARGIETEVRLGMGEDGALTSFDQGMFVGILDAVWDSESCGDTPLIITDWKTGRNWGGDDEFERHMYVALARQKYMPITDFYFQRIYPAEPGSKARAAWHYSYVSPRKVEITDLQTNEKTTFRGRGADPLVRYLQKELKRIRKLDPIPTPGPHCESWFGEPCQFLGGACPIAKFVPEVKNWQDIPKAIGDKILALPEAQRPGAAYIALQRDLPIEMSRAIAGLAYEGLLQLKGANRKVNDKIKRWLKESGEDFEAGGETYGLVVSRKVDKVTALQMLLSQDLPVEDLAKAIEISVSSLSRLSHKYPDVIPFIIDAAVQEKDGASIGKRR